METDNKMDFLDITTSNSRSRLELYISTTDNTVLWPIIAVIPQNIIKHAAIRYFATTMNQYPTRNAKRYT